ncbi:MAG TPA: response regulator [bacterium]|nr:response regulator [bacterium]
MEKILVVDDSELIRQMLFDLLSAEGYGVTVASDSAQAMAEIRKETPDLIFMDIMMPGMDGQLVTRLIKSDKKYEGIPIIVFSSLATEAHTQLSEKVGAAIHMKKTTPPAEILGTVRKILDERGKAKDQ